MSPLKNTSKRNPDRPTQHTFRGKKFNIRWKPPRDSNRVGECDDPKYARPFMLIHPQVTGQEKLYALLDESIHACNFDIDNDVVDIISTDIGKFLWKCGLRFRNE